MRAFKTKGFHRWAGKEGIPDAALFQAAREIVAGKVEAALGHSLFKKRIARAGKGKSSGFRVIVGYRSPNSDRIFFVYGFPKNARANISELEKEALAKVAKTYLEAQEQVIATMLAKATLFELKEGVEA